MGPCLGKPKNKNLKRQRSTDQSKVQSNSLTDSHKNQNKKSKSSKETVKPLSDQETSKSQLPIKSIDDSIGCSDLHPNTSFVPIDTCITKSTEIYIEDLSHQENDQVQSNSLTDSHKNQNKKSKSRKETVKPLSDQETSKSQLPNVKSIDDSIGCSDLHPNTSFVPIDTCITKSTEISIEDLSHQENDQLESQLESTDNINKTEQENIISNDNELKHKVSELSALLSKMSITEYNTLSRKRFFSAMYEFTSKDISENRLKNSQRLSCGSSEINTDDENIRNNNSENAENVETEEPTCDDMQSANSLTEFTYERYNISQHTASVEEKKHDSEKISSINSLDEETSENRLRESKSLSSISSEINRDDENIRNNNSENAENVETEEPTCDDMQSANSLTEYANEICNISHHTASVEEKKHDSEKIRSINSLDEETSENRLRESKSLSSISSEINRDDEIIRNNNSENAENVETDEPTCDDMQSANSLTECANERYNISHHTASVEEKKHDSDNISSINYLDENTSENHLKESSSSPKNNINYENIPNNNYENVEIQDKNWIPRGFSNPIGYCYLNSVVQSLASCHEFRRALASYENTTNNKNEDIIFVEGLCNLIRGLRENDKNNIESALNTIQSHNNESAFGDDIFKCFMNVLSRISNVIGNNNMPLPNEISNIDINDEAEMTFQKSRNKNQGFVFDNFYGQLTFQIVCKLCNYVINQSFQLMKSLSLPIPNKKDTNKVTMNMCIDLFLAESEIDSDDTMPCECSGGCTDKLVLLTKITHAPKYLFIYLNRGSYFDSGVKNDTFVSCGFQIRLQTTKGSISYDLISVIDHVGTNEFGHYYCKCCYDGETWWYLNDSRAAKMSRVSDVVSEDSIGFIFKKQQNMNSIL